MRNALERANGVEPGSLEPPQFVKLDEVKQRGCAYLLWDQKLSEASYKYTAKSPTGDFSHAGNRTIDTSASPELLGTPCADIIEFQPPWNTKTAIDFTDQDITSFSGKLKEQGESFTNDVCTVYFAGLDQVASGTDFTKNELNVFLTSITALMGVLQTSASQLTVLAVTNTAISATLDNSGKLYLFSPSPSLIKPAVDAAFERYKTAHQSDPINTYKQAHEWIMGYADICTPIRIRAIIEDTMKKGTQQIKDDTAAQTLTQAAVNQAIQAVSALLGADGAMSIQQASLVYWYVGDTAEGANYHDGLPSERRLAFEAELSNALPNNVGVQLINLAADTTPEDKKRLSSLRNLLRAMSTLNAGDSGIAALAKKNGAALKAKLNVH